MFVDSASAIDRVETDAFGSGQRFATGTMEVCDRVISPDNEIAIRRVPAHGAIPSNEKADEFTKAVASGADPCNDDDVPYELR